MTPARAFLGIFRLLIGFSAWLTPDLTAKSVGVTPETSNRFVVRLFGTRETALGLGLLAAPPKGVAQVAALGAAIDTVDAIAGFDEMRRGNMSTHAILTGPVGLIPVIALGAYVAAEASRSTDET